MLRKVGAAGLARAFFIRFTAFLVVMLRISQSDSEYINVTLSEDNKELAYEIKLNLTEQDKLFALTSSDLLNYVTENWANDATPRRELAEMDGLIITYHFTTASKTDFRTIKVGPEIDRNP